VCDVYGEWVGVPVVVRDTVGEDRFGFVGQLAVLLECGDKLFDYCGHFMTE